MPWSFDVDTLSAVLQQLDAASDVARAACVSRMWSLTVQAEPAVELPMKALAMKAKGMQSAVTEAMIKLHNKPGFYGFDFATGRPFKQTFFGEDLAVLQTKKRQAEALESQVEAWLSKRRRSRDINAPFLLVELS